MKKLPTLDTLPLPQVLDFYSRFRSLKNWRINGVYVIVRASLNVPMRDGTVADESRLLASVPTLQWLRERGAKIVVLGHLGRDGDTLRPVADVLAQRVPLTFLDGAYEDAQVRDAVHAMQDGDIVMLENVRRDAREEAGDTAYAELLASYGELFVLDAFADAHREHASITGIAKILPTVFGLSFQKEYEALSQAVEPQAPSLAIIGGAKFDTKTPLVKALAKKYTHVFIGGALMNDIYKARGYEVGVSVVGDAPIDADILALENLIVPTDVLVKNKNGDVRNVLATEIQPGDMVVDIGEESFATLAGYIDTAATIVWNGPLGYYEGGFDRFTNACAVRIAARGGVTTIVGGGDTIAAIAAENTAASYTHISTAGGAMLTFLETGTLPVIEQVMQSNQ